MPPREPKARLLTREYVADRDFMTAFSAEEREWYLLTALYADDAGYLEWNLAENAANLYRFESPEVREARVSACIASFAASGRFRAMRCGHAVMPRVAKRPRGGGREYAVRDSHEVHCRSTRSRQKSTASALHEVHPESTPVVDSSAPESTPILSGPVPDLSGPTRARARSDETKPGSFREAMAAAGYVAPSEKGR